uniref:Uncharacterized protein n=1 Tax=Rhizophora mucronata TaxID=61149 RepID=A0A2P2NA45_RHIMU
MQSKKGFDSDNYASTLRC